MWPYSIERTALSAPGRFDAWFPPPISALGIILQREFAVDEPKAPVPSLRRDRCAQPTARTAGFSLLEVLVAFVILALVGTALFRLFSGALGNASLSEEYSRATLFAESRLASPGVDTPLKQGVEQGVSDDGYYRWTVTIEPYTPPNTTPDMEGAAAAMPSRLWRIVATVRWPGAPGSERSVALTTLRLAAKTSNS